MLTITDELVQSNIKRAYSEFQRYAKEYNKGLLGNIDDYYNRGESIIWHYFFNFLEENCILLMIKEANYGCFLEDYAAFCEGSNYTINENQPWLYNFDRKAEASKDEKRLFFYLMEKFHFPPSYFESIPEKYLKPDLFQIHMWNDFTAYCTDFNCVDDGGLLEDKNPIGKTFRLVNDLGLEAVVTIKEDRRFDEHRYEMPENKSEQDFDIANVVVPELGGMILHNADFLADGYIEGYTTKERKYNYDTWPYSDPKILIRANKKGEICYLAFLSGQADDEARMNFPLWQESFSWFDEHWKKTNQIKKEFAEYFLNQ